MIVLASLGAVGCNGDEPMLDGPIAERGFDLEDEATPQLTADQILAEVGESSYVQVPYESLSEAELEKLTGLADEIVEFDDPEDSERFIAYAKGELALLNSAPIGLESATFEWSDFPVVEEHGRVFAYLSQYGLIGALEATLTPGTWLTSKHAAAVLPKSEVEGLAQFEFESFADVEEALGDDEPAMLDNCGATTCTPPACGSCRTTIHFAWNHIIILRQRTCHSHCSNNCGCTGSTQSTQAC